jgi:hypothetical protein
LKAKHGAVLFLPLVPSMARRFIVNEPYPVRIT